MIGPSDRVVLAPGVGVDGRGLTDTVRGVAIPLNDAARLVVEHTTPERAAHAVSERFDVTRDAALADVLRFSRELIYRLLVNVRPRYGSLTTSARWLRALPVLLPAAHLPRVPASRRTVDTTTPVRLFVSAVRALAGPATVYGLGAVVVALFAVVAAGGGASVAGTAGAAVAAGVVLHELGHLVALVHVPAFVAARGLRVAVMHRALPPLRTTVVAAAGPLAGIAAALAAAVAPAIVATAEMATATSVLTLQALGLTVVSRDGRRLCGLH